MSQSAKLQIQLGCLGVALAWLLFHVMLAVVHGTNLGSGTVLGPDSYMRLVRIEALLEGSGWFNDVIDRANAPYGDLLHWTRPFDVLVIALAVPLAPFLGWQDALYWAGSLASPLLQLLTALAFGWAVYPFMKTKVWFFPAITILLQPVAAAAGVPGRVDHHALFLLVFVLQWGFLLRALANRHDDDSPVWAGLLAGFGFWLSSEFLLPFLLLAGSLGIAWLLDPHGRWRQNLRFAGAGLAMTAVALLAEHGAVIPPLYYDEIGMPSLLIAMLLTAFWFSAGIDGLSRFTDTVFGRVLFAGAGTVIAATIIYVTIPKFFAGPMADVDPRIGPIWLDWVLEMRDLIPDDRESLGELIIYLGHAALALPFLVWRIWREDDITARLPWIAILFTALAFGLVALFHVRFASYAQIAFVFGLAGLVDMVFTAAAATKNDLLRGLQRGGIIVVLFIGPMVCGKIISNAGLENFADPKKAGTASEVCDVQAAGLYLDDDTAFPGSQIILAFLDIGPQILYHTRHQVIGTPYHRNGRGIAEGHEMLATPDIERARVLIAERRVDLILLCPDSPEKNFFSSDGEEGGLFTRLNEGDLPDWIEPVELPEGLKESFKLFRPVL